MTDHARVIREALDALDEASHGWNDGNQYMRAHAAAVPALDALVADHAEALALLTEAYPGEPPTNRWRERVEKLGAWPVEAQ